MLSSRLPASPREVIATSSSFGWRQTICAARAPAKPEAPATSTRAVGSPSSGCASRSATQRPPDLSQRGLDRGARLADLVVGEGAIGGAELQPQGQALATLADLHCFVEGEAIGGRTPLSPAGKDRLAPVIRHHSCGHDHGQVLVAGATTGPVLVGLLA